MQTSNIYYQANKHATSKKHVKEIKRTFTSNIKIQKLWMLFIGDQVSYVFSSKWSVSYKKESLFTSMRYFAIFMFLFLNCYKYYTKCIIAKNNYSDFQLIKLYSINHILVFDIYIRFFLSPVSLISYEKQFMHIKSIVSNQSLGRLYGSLDRQNFLDLVI